MKDILARVELELTTQQLAAIRSRAISRKCSEEEYVRHLVGAAMMQNVLATPVEDFEEGSLCEGVSVDPKTPR